MLSLLILAAGESSRMRSPKALLKIGDETFVECIIRKAIESKIQSIYVITGPDHERIVAQIPEGIACIKNEDSMRGQISSLQKGIHHLPRDVSAVLVWPVDQPLIQEDTVRHLIETYHRTLRILTIPVYQLKKGHPVIYSKQAMQSALRLRSDQTGKDLQSLFLTETHLVEVNDPAILIDIDTPEDYSRHIEERPH